MLDGCPRPNWGKEHLEPNPQPKHAVANSSQSISPMLPPGEYRSSWSLTIPPAPILLWSLLYCGVVFASDSDDVTLLMCSA